MSRWIPVSAPALLGNETRYVLECMETTWISSIGRFIRDFERQFAEQCGVRHAIACNNGTTALHAALLGLGIGPGDRVLVPSLTYVASANSIRYCGAEPVFVDSDRRTWNLDPDDMARKAPGAKAVMPVHLYGRPCDMSAVREIAERQGLLVIEDAAEAIGASLGGSQVGTLGAVGCFSFFGNKILTTGEGGMVVTDDDELAVRVRQIKGQGQDPNRRYWFPIIGYNYRMTNIQAAIGLAQLEQLNGQLAARDAIARWYRNRLDGIRGLRLPLPDAAGMRSVCWLFSVVLENARPGQRDAVIEALRAQGVETRPFFFPCHTLPPYKQPADVACPVSEWLGERGLSLPTWVGMSEEDVGSVASALGTALTTLGTT
jgi:perosamine synthetase